jgi:hypothetical protein
VTAEQGYAHESGSRERLYKYAESGVSGRPWSSLTSQRHGLFPRLLHMAPIHDHYFVQNGCDSPATMDVTLLPQSEQPRSS